MPAKGTCLCSVRVRKRILPTYAISGIVSPHMYTLSPAELGPDRVKMVHQILVGMHILASVETKGLAYFTGLD